MMLTELKCIEATCDGCGEREEDGDGNICHYPSRSEAEAFLVQSGDWIVRDGKHWHEWCAHLLEAQEGE